MLEALFLPISIRQTALQKKTNLYFLSNYEKSVIIEAIIIIIPVVLQCTVTLVLSNNILKIF